MSEVKSRSRNKQNESFLVSWTIENFRFVDKRTNTVIKSPVFAVDSMRRTRWHLRFFPNVKGTEQVGVYLSRSEDKCNDSIFLNYQIKIIKAGNVLTTYQTTGHEFKNSDRVGYGNRLLEHNEIFSEQTEARLDYGVILIECEMWKAENDLEESRSITADNCHFESIGKNINLLYDYPSGNFDILEDIDRIEQSFLHPSNQCSIGTVINVKEAELHWTVERFSALHKNKKKMAVLKYEFSESLAVLILYLNNDDVLQIDILVNRTLTDYKSMHCHLSVRDKHNGVERSFQKVCYFESGAIRMLSFPDVINRPEVLAAKEKLLDRDALNLHFLFTFVEEPSCTYTIYSTGSKSKIPQPDAQENRISREMEDLFVSRKHSDVTLRAGSQDISCHKAIVCHRSPVLDAMFTADMQERKTGVVHVSDVDPDTLNTLLRYMYTGGVDEMGVQEYMKLYVASDKYQVSSLTRESRRMLEENLSVDNVCDILLCADAHSDVTLKKCSMDFIRSNVSRVFSSDEWRSIAKDNPTLASEVILLVTTKLQKR